MRQRIVFVLLLGLLAASGVLVLSRDKTAHKAPDAPPPPALPSGEAAPKTGASASAAGSGSASASSTAPIADAGPVKLFDRPLRVAALGWDLAAPAILANAGLDAGAKSELTAAGLDAKIFIADSMTSVEGALARGGADKDGADVAVVPLSHFVASYERLRALSPEVFFVVGWSRGREALVSTREGLPAPTDKGVDLKAGLPMVGAAGEPATFLGLFALDANGIPPSAVKLVTQGSKPDDPALAAVDRDAAPPQEARHSILLTTADATRLVPFVAVAPHGLLDKNPKAMAAFARAWLEGARKLEADAPGAARQIASASGAPEPIALLKRLGEISSASLYDNARSVGLSGRGALTLEALFQKSWQLWRGVGALATPAPDAAPINTTVVAALAQSSPALLAPPKPPVVATAKDDARALLTFKEPEGKLDEPGFLSTSALLAEAFERSPLRIAVARGGALDGAATKKTAADIEARFDVATGRLAVAKKVPPKASASLEVLAAQ